MKSPGVVVCASDTLEYIPDPTKSFPLVDIILFAHHSTITIAKQHGVYVLKNNRLWRVLQKPNEDELRANEALFLNETQSEHTDVASGKQCEKLNREELALTDSFYIISMNIADSLIKLLHKTSVTIECETCCYGDYLRPLGESPLWDYLQCSDERLALARKTFADLFRGKTTEVVQLPRNSFFHFGTIPELLNHFAVASVFLNRFQITDPHKCLYSVLDGSQIEIGEKSIVEFCEFNRGAKIGNSCLISSCSSDRYVVLPDGICLTTIILNQDQTRLSSAKIRLWNFASSNAEPKSVTVA
ncbi:unnamed protein product [Anisakis simplex]|uniref:Fucose-1-phosphate guanylyltransferase (inferred by orthology to a human protein) n=1 Tax=Anisakis simplex TaxID=6269 RepID=A0A0M3KFU6_ANISI|nr:unnamed protein product [Anisakis simplex]